MKTKILTRGFQTALFSGVALLFAASCSNDNDVEPGNAQVKVVNAAQGANSQDFFLVNNKLVSALRYGDDSDYLMANAGNNLTAEFKNAGTETVYASGNLDLNRDVHYSVIVAGAGEQSRIITAEDDMTEPSEGKAKVRFVHVSDVYKDQTVYVVNESDAIVSNNIGYNSVTNYVEIDPTIALLKVGLVGSTDFRNLSLEAFLPNNTYTIILTGSGDVEAIPVTHN